MRLERIRAKDAALILGEPVRTVQAMAARGEIPGAAKLTRAWTFDERALRAWLTDRVRAHETPSEKRRQVRIGAAISSGVASRSRGGKSGSPYEQMMQRLLRGGLKPAASAK